MFGINSWKTLPRNVSRAVSFTNMAVRRFQLVLVTQAVVLSFVIAVLGTTSASASSPVPSVRSDSEKPAAGPVLLELTLDEAVKMALQRNRSIKDYEFAADSTEIGVRAARAFFDIKIKPLSSVNYSSGDESEVTVWEVGGSVSKIFQTGIRVDLRPSVAFGDDEYDAGLGFSVAVPLLRGFGSEVVLDDVYIKEFSRATALRNLHRQRVATMVETISAVYSFVRETRLIALYKEQLVDLNNHLKLASIKERAGLARSMDVYRVEIRIKEVEDTLNLAQERLENVSDRLKSVLALPLDTEINIDAPMVYSFIAINTNEALDTAFQKRIEIKQGAADITEARRKSKVAYLNTRPNLDLQANYTRKGRSDEFDRLFVFDQDVFRIGLSSDTDLSRSAEKSRWEQSRITVNRERLQFATTKEDIIREIRSVLNSLAKSRERISLRREQIIQATGKQQLAQVKFQHGEADNFDLVESQSEVERARANLLTDELQYIVGGYKLRAAMGTLLEYDGI